MASVNKPKTKTAAKAPTKPAVKSAAKTPAKKPATKSKQATVKVVTGHNGNSPIETIPQASASMEETLAVATVGIDLESELTPKQQLFVAHFAECLNATEAARRAGYDGTYDSLRVIGCENLTKLNIATAISKRLAQVDMGPHETRARLSRIARGSIEPFLYRSEGNAEKGEPAYLDVNSPEARANADLIKKIKTKSIEKISTDGEGDGKGDSMVRVVEVELELHDPVKVLLEFQKLHEKAPPTPPGAPGHVTVNGNIQTVNLGEKTPDQAKEMLAKILGVPVQSLPKDAAELLQPLPNGNTTPNATG